MDDARRAIDERQAAEIARLETEHEIAVEATATAFAKKCAAEFAPLVEAFVHAPNRPEAVALAVKYRALNSAAKTALGRELGPELGFAFAQHRINRSPDLVF